MIHRARIWLIRLGKVLPFVVCFVVMLSYSETAFSLATNDTNIRVMLSRLSEKGFVKRIATDDRRYGKIIIK